MNRIDLIANAIKNELKRFSDPAYLYIEGEAGSRWEKANPNSDGWHDFDNLESYRIIARAVDDALKEEEGR